jgi:hypothetical protein
MGWDISENLSWEVQTRVSSIASQLLAIECLRLGEEPEFIPTWVAIPGTRKFPRLREVTFECASPQFIVAFMNMKDVWSLRLFLCAMPLPPPQRRKHCTLPWP